MANNLKVIMPTYQYECDACDHDFEAFQYMLDKKLKTCPQCGKDELHRLIGAGGGIIFKGSGFYETDYKRKESPASASEGVAQGTASDKAKSEPGKCPMADAPKCKGCGEGAG